MKTKAVRTNAGTSRRPSDQEIREWIAEAAYYRAEKRGFLPGMETDDWVAAEAEVLARTGGGQPLL
jgi:hypothetical protein